MCHSDYPCAIANIYGCGITTTYVPSFTIICKCTIIYIKTLIEVSSTVTILSQWQAFNNNNIERDSTFNMAVLQTAEKLLCKILDLVLQMSRYFVRYNIIDTFVIDHRSKFLEA